MTKARTKPKAAPVGDCPTAERLARSAAIEVPAVRMADESWSGPARKSMLILSPVKRWHQVGWLDDAGFVALHAYETMVEAAGYQRSRSCLDFTPKGEGGLPPAVVAARDKLAVISFAARFGCDGLAWDYVEAVLRPGAAENEETIAGNMLVGVGRDRARAIRKGWVSGVAKAMAEVLA